MKFSFTRQIVLFSLALIITGNEAKGQVVINEFLASNKTINQDPDFYEYADWIELYNAGVSNINLNGYYVTDDLNEPDK